MSRLIPLSCISLLIAGCAEPKVIGEGDGVADDVQVGWIAEIIGNFHEVGGTAEIIDENTIEVTDWTFDGGGLNARLFLAVDGAPFFSDYELTDNLVGEPSDGVTLTLPIPDQAELENWDSIVMWCVPVGAIFGMGVFEAP